MFLAFVIERVGGLSYLTYYRESGWTDLRKLQTKKSVSMKTHLVRRELEVPIVFVAIQFFPEVVDVRFTKSSRRMLMRK